MNDPFGVSFEKTAFQTGPGLYRIRWGVFNGLDGQPRVAAFKVSAVDSQFALEAGKNYTTESDIVVRTENALTGPKYQAYEWVGDRFENVDAQEQKWFKF